MLTDLAKGLRAAFADEDEGGRWQLLAELMPGGRLLSDESGVADDWLG
ncbi:hypothetical protein ACGF0D_17945 [Kitasatospora sp. NPDC048298]